VVSSSYEILIFVVMLEILEKSLTYVPEVEEKESERILLND